MQVTKAGLERLKSANDLSDVAAERGIELRRRGKGLVGHCPFHSPDNTPSFNVTPGKGLFKCFGCGAAGDVIGFVGRLDQVGFPEAVRTLARRAGLDLGELMDGNGGNGHSPGAAHESAEAADVGTRRVWMPAKSVSSPAPAVEVPADVLSRVVDHYHRTFCERKDAQGYLAGRGLRDPDLLRVLRVGYADGSLLRAAPKSGELREQLVHLGVITAEGRELLGGCVVVPIPDPGSGAWVNLYGRGVKVARHCYLPGPQRGVLNFQAARMSEEVILAESVLDALSFLQAGVATAIPIYGTNGFTGEMLDLLKREGVRRVTLVLDNDEAGRKAADTLGEKLSAAGLAVRVAALPEGIKDPNELLVSRNGDAGEAFRRLLDEAEPRPALGGPAGADSCPDAPQPAAAGGAGADAGPAPAGISREEGQLVLRRGALTYRARVYPASLGRLRATVRLEGPSGFHVDTIDLYSSRSRAEYAKRAARVAVQAASVIEGDLLALVVEAEKAAGEEAPPDGEPDIPAMSEAERLQALALLRRADLLDQIARDVDVLGYVGEETNKRLLYLVAVSRKLADPLSAIVLSQSGAGKSGITEVIERLTPPEDVVLLTRLTPQSLYYTPPGFLDKKLVIVEERYGSVEADYSIRVLQSRKKLIAAAPVKDPLTGNMRTKVFTVEARAAFIEATTASSVNHENATRCFELTMDESAEQTRRIHERQRHLKTKAGLAACQAAETLCRCHWNAQRLLESLPVVIPFAELLSFPSEWMRTRRDHARFLNLIEVSAFLHQHQRVREDGAIVATAADYAVAYALGAEVLAETLTDVRKPLREAFTRIQALSAEGEGTVTRRDIREALNVPDSTVRRWLGDLVELEYLVPTEASKGGQGRSTRYRVAETGTRQAVLTGLLTPAQLAAKVQGAL